MFTPNLNDPAAVLAHLGEPLKVLHLALDDGVSFADLTLEGLPPDAHIWAHLVRYRARNHLATETSDGWQLGRMLPNSGIELVCNPLVVRALKTQDGGPPHPGHSAAKHGFWNQMQQLRLALPFGGKIMPQGANLIVDWTIDTDKSVLLALSKPVGTWKYKAQPKLEWRKPVIFDATHEPAFLGSDEDVSVTPKYDLSELKEDGEVG